MIKETFHKQQTDKLQTSTIRSNHTDHFFYYYKLSSWLSNPRLENAYRRRWSVVKKLYRLINLKSKSLITCSRPNDGANVICPIRILARNVIAVNFQIKIDISHDITPSFFDPLQMHTQRSSQNDTVAVFETRDQHRSFEKCASSFYLRVEIFGSNFSRRPLLLSIGDFRNGKRLTTPEAKWGANENRFTPKRLPTPAPAIRPPPPSPAVPLHPSHQNTTSRTTPHPKR